MPAPGCPVETHSAADPGAQCVGPARGGVRGTPGLGPCPPRPRWPRCGPGHRPGRLRALRHQCPVPCRKRRSSLPRAAHARTGVRAAAPAPWACGCPPSRRSARRRTAGLAPAPRPCPWRAAAKADRRWPAGCGGRRCRPASECAGPRRLLQGCAAIARWPAPRLADRQARAAVPWPVRR